MSGGVSGSSLLLHPHPQILATVDAAGIQPSFEQCKTPLKHHNTNQASSQGHSRCCQLGRGFKAWEGAEVFAWSWNGPRAGGGEPAWNSALPQGCCGQEDLLLPATMPWPQAHGTATRSLQAAGGCLNVSPKYHPRRWSNVGKEGCPRRECSMGHRSMSLCSMGHCCSVGKKKALCRHPETLRASRNNKLNI